MLVLIALLLLPFWKFFRTIQREIPQSTAPVSESSFPPFFWRNADFAIPGDVSSSRPVYPYSVIPHGVESARELQEAIHRDPVVSRHYSDFRVRAARRIRLASERRFFVSYRIGNQIYWTKKKMTLHSGEVLLSDGEHFARTRCGNRLSEVPTTPTSPSEPTNGNFDTPVVPLRPELITEEPPGSPVSPAGAPSVLTFSSNPTSQRTPGPGGFVPPFIPIPCCVTSSGPSPSPHSPIHPVLPPPIPAPPPPGTPPSGPPPQPLPYFPPGPPSSPPAAPPVAAPEPSALTLAAFGLILWLVVRKLRQN